MGFQDVEALIVPFYELAVPDIRVATRVPRPRPHLFVRVWRTGGTATNRVLDAPIVTTEVWGTDDSDADELPDIANRLRDALYGRSSLIPPVRHVEEVTGPYWDPDPDSAAPRYTFTSRLFVRAKF